MIVFANIPYLSLDHVDEFGDILPLSAIMASNYELNKDDRPHTTRQGDERRRDSRHGEAEGSVPVVRIAAASEASAVSAGRGTRMHRNDQSPPGLLSGYARSKSDEPEAQWRDHSHLVSRANSQPHQSHGLVNKVSKHDYFKEHTTDMCKSSTSVI